MGLFKRKKKAEGTEKYGQQAQATNGKRKSYKLNQDLYLQSQLNIDSVITYPTPKSAPKTQPRKKKKKKKLPSMKSGNMT